ncbi:nuclear transport factor 2 family protein [Hyphomonas johnsonii]|uniref:SnoaL-like domain-containing protein n=1 Tax=Hyphomonas johnsonii MHS-2 TaxID=1280950 RepID=A0A059FE39_9PROT|nr:nuclear transport factor 2 family protein [Hyphomonas johnsonii]KCZ88862.1 hypothetical protein HJO_15134 [Hyphomonas johnsonii MHS-2]
MKKEQIEHIADQFFAAVESGDLDALVANYHPDVRIWHSRDEADTDIAQSKELLSVFFERVSERKYEILRREYFDGGFVQEHVVHGVMQDGSRFKLPVGFLCHVDENGLIRRIAEYCDSNKSPLRGLRQDHTPANTEASS